MTQIVEVITSSERKRHHSDEFKEKVVNACLQEGVNNSAIARQFGISPSLLFKWKKDFQDRNSCTAAMISQNFARVRVKEDGLAQELQETPLFIHIGDELTIELPAKVNPNSLANYAAAIKDRLCGH